MPSTIIDSAIFQGIFSTDEMRHVWSDENRTEKYLDIEAALAKVQGELGLIPAEAAEEIISHCHLDQIDLPRLREQTERIGYPILGVVTQVNQLCRDGLGEYVHWGATTQDITDTATVLQIREALDLVDAELTAISAGLADAGQEAPRHPDDRAQQPAAGHPDHLRLQDGRAALRGRAAPGPADPAARAGAGRRVRRRRGHPGLAGDRGHGNPGRAVRRAGPGPAGDRLAHHPGQHRRGRRVPRAGRRHPGQAQHGRQADDADRGRRGLRALRARPRLLVHHAAEAQPDLQLLHPRRDLRGPPARRRADGRHGRRPRALHRPVGDRVDRAARGVLPDGRRAQAGPRHRRGTGGRRRRDAPQHRPHRRAGDERGRDDGPGPLHRPRVRARPRLRHLPRRRGQRPPAAGPARRAPGDQQAPRPRRPGQALRPGELPGPGRRDGGPGARPAASINEWADRP